MTAFFRFFAERNLLAYLITIIVMVLGLSTLTQIKRDNFPQVEFGEMFVTTRYPGGMNISELLQPRKFLPYGSRGTGYWWRADRLIRRGRPMSQGKKRACAACEPPGEGRRQLGKTSRR